MEKVSELAKEIRQRHRDGSESVYHLTTLTDREIARRMAIWHRRKLASYRRYEEKHGSRTYRWLIVECTDGSELKLNAADMEPYFRHLPRWTEEGVYFYEDRNGENWWILADYFSV